MGWGCRLCKEALNSTQTSTAIVLVIFRSKLSSQGMANIILPCMYNSASFKTRVSILRLLQDQQKDELGKNFKLGYLNPHILYKSLSDPLEHDLLGGIEVHQIGDDAPILKERNSPSKDVMIDAKVAHFLVKVGHWSGWQMIQC